MNLPIRARITIWYVLLLALLISALGTFVVVRLRTDLTNGVDATLATRAQQIALAYKGTTDGEFQDVSDASLQGLPGGESGAQLLDSSAAVVESSGDAAVDVAILGPTEVVRVLGGDTVTRSISLGRDSEPFRILAVSLPGTAQRIIVVATSLDTVDSSVDRLTGLLLLAGPTLLLIAGLGGWWVARAALNPVAHISRKAGEIGIQDLDARVEVPETADEIHDLAVTMNAMLERLERGVKDQRRFIADASHELRTPLAIMLTEVEVSLREPRLGPEARGTLGSMRQELEGMGSTVENLLTLARADEGHLTLAREQFDLREAADGIREALSQMSAASGVTVELEGGSAQVVADRSRIEQVLRNLLSNALRYSGRGSHVMITTHAGDGSVRCSIADDGPGIPDSALPHVFDRFFRSDPSRTGAGAGLGLAICREIVTTHGGTIVVESVLGRGTAFTFSIPTIDAKTG